MKFRTNKKFTDTDNAPYWIEKALKEGITHVNICGFERECAVSLHLCLYLLYSHKFHEVISAPIDYKKAYDNLKIYADYYDDHTLDEPKLSMADLQYLGEFDLEKLSVLIFILLIMTIYMVGGVPELHCVIIMEKASKKTTNQQ